MATPWNPYVIPINRRNGQEFKQTENTLKKFEIIC